MPKLKKIDINEPVEQGADLVLNHPDGSQTLGTVEDRDKAEKLQGLHTNPLPGDEEAAGDSDELPETPEEEPVGKKSKK